MKLITSIAASAALAISAFAVPSVASANEILSDQEAMEKCGFNAQQVGNGFYCVKSTITTVTTRSIGSGKTSSSTRCQDAETVVVTYSSYNQNNQLMEDRTVVESSGEQGDWGASYAC
ncbi:MAG: hypothetical protein U1E18_02480 [Brevundimonas sp.]|uniref:hypothetical protein n=1 Tax=Brevundimonas sp. TaxID=1871086 RepID=UPI002ABBE0AF|nr:hypothetical protein [Brevundimonas sp.]MDZ4108448.1 hypothetical protein [Brevundimonas sp.]